MKGFAEKTGRFTEIRLIGDVRIDDGCLVLAARARRSSPPVPGGDGRQPDSRSQDLVVHRPRPRGSRALDATAARAVSSPIPIARATTSACPRTWACPAIRTARSTHNGRYHLMYLYNRSGSGFCWGHISSDDLVHWRHHPDAIGPGQGDEGCFSGGAFVDDDGTRLSLLLDALGRQGHRPGHEPRTRDFDPWTKLDANPVIRSTEWGITEAKDAGGKTFLYGSADPSNIWKKDGRYYMLTGNLLVLNKIGRAADAPLSEQGDRLYLFVSDDLKNWKYLHVFYERNPEWTDRSEDNMCPSFLPLPSSPDGRAAERQAPAAVHQPQQGLPVLRRRLPERPVLLPTTTGA